VDTDSAVTLVPLPLHHYNFRLMLEGETYGRGAAKCHYQFVWAM